MDRAMRNRTGMWGNPKGVSERPSGSFLRFPAVILLFLLVSAPAPAQVSVVPGYSITPVVTGGLNNPTGLSRDSNGFVYIAEHAIGGSPRFVVSLTRPGSARDFSVIPSLDTPSGVLAVGSSVFVTNRDQGIDTGQVIKYTDRNGNIHIDGVEEFDIVYSSLPQGANGTRSLALGPGGRVYVGQGSIGFDSVSEPPGVNTTVFSFDPASTQTPPPTQTFATGFFNPLGISFASDGTAFISDRMPPTVDAPDELNAAAAGDYFGFGVPPVPGEQPKAPLVTFPRFSRPAGVAHFEPSEFTNWEEVVFVALEGHPAWPNITDPEPRVVRVVLNRDAGGLTATVSDFVTGLQRPYGLLKVNPGTGEESLMISDFSADLVYQVNRKPLDPRDVDQSGFVDSGDLYIMMRERHLLAGGEPPDPLLTDFDDNGVIDARDLFYLAEGWEGDPAN